MRLDKEILTGLEEAARQKGGAPQEQNGQDGEGGPEHSERRRIWRRRKAHLKAALLGRSRGGLTSKVHPAADRRCRPRALVLTAGQTADSPQFIPVLDPVYRFAASREAIRFVRPTARPTALRTARPGRVRGTMSLESRPTRRCRGPTSRRSRDS